MQNFLLRLFITGRTPQAERAISNISRICGDELAGRAQLEVVDLLRSPEQAAPEGILATPTLIRAQPLPPRRIIGDLSDRARLLAWLEVPSGHEGDDAPR